MKLHFLGATGTVTGSKYLIENNGYRFLVDCGLFQGLKDLRLRNWAKFPVPPETISAVVLTHAHLDHSGYLPLLIKQGFHGKIFCSPATYDLCKILLPDSGKLQEEEERPEFKHFSDVVG
jgi:metallo-beta-lactamase family protein